MKLRFSLFHLMVTTVLVALSITVVVLYGKLQEERRLRLEVMQKGGILEVSDLDKVHVVSVSSREESDTYRWRVYVPKGRSVTLNTNSLPSPDRNSMEPRISSEVNVSPARNATDRIKIPEGEHVITYKYIQPERESYPGRFSIDIRSDTFKQKGYYRSNHCNLRWLAIGAYEDLTDLERPGIKPKRFPGSRRSTVYNETTKCVEDNIFVLFRFRESNYLKTESNIEEEKVVPEVYGWLSIEE